jgi:S1/P1 Nuclease
MHGACTALQFPHGKPVRLRTYWDDEAVADALGKDPEAAADRLVAGMTQADLVAGSNLGPEAWVQQSYAVARSAVYALPAEPADANYAFPPEPGEKNPCAAVKLYPVDARYQKRAQATVREQLARAGVRLAYLLREDLH